MEQIPITVTPCTWEERLEQTYRELRADNARAFAALREFTNRAFGQKRRYILEYIEDMKRIYL